MNINRIIPLVIAVITILFTASCKKERNTSGGTRISKMVFNRGLDSTAIVDFAYYSNGSLESITRAFNNTTNLITRYFYDAAGKLQRTEQTSIYNNYVATHLYTYEGDNLVQKLYNQSPGYEYSYKYAYNAAGKLVRDTSFGNSSNPGYYTEFLYAGDNVSEWQYFYKAATLGWQQGGTAKATYTTIDNPFYAFGSLFYVTSAWGLENGIISLSSKLVSQIQQSNGQVTEYIYDFYSDGLPKKVTIRMTTAPTYEQTIEFYYE